MLSALQTARTALKCRVQQSIVCGPDAHMGTYLYIYVDGVDKDKDDVEERTLGKGRCIQNSIHVTGHGMCVLIGSIETYEY